MVLRVVVSWALLVALAACSGERQAAVQGTTSPGDDRREAPEPAAATPVPDPNDVMHGAASRGGEAGGPGDEVAEPAPEPAPQPIELDLRLPQERADADDSLFPLTPEPRLPDMFRDNERQRRTTVSGELILGNDEEEGFNLDRIQGGTVEVEVSID